MARNPYPERNKIVYLKADNNYTVFHLASGKKMMSSFTLKHHEHKAFLSGFIRPNRSFLINPKYIEQVVENNSLFFIKMSNGDSIETSKRRKKRLRVEFMAVLEKVQPI
ncbi:hypothetical protein GCM10011514_53220 [Emticicia aquatilis]|uniref:HTH LytTR-type domain-containing protein n=1 Tax=Emticicia aquatilis TaxID=1537369 RepID=A0A916ZA73_9BACT|nr:LytTR family DNA-binding domain-containing protein [Emticicia aquatilis]GGD82497.1 hypothetical protein GCM10011514_53220 [Emticicia aquatilis]